MKKVYVLTILETGCNGNSVDALVFGTKKKAQEKMKELYKIDIESADKDESYCERNSAFALFDDYDITYEIEEKEIN